MSKPITKEPDEIEANVILSEMTFDEPDEPDECQGDCDNCNRDVC